MVRIYLLLGLIALSVFSWAQYRGVGLFDDEAPSSQSRSGSGGHRSYHK
ncbi:hypothetical protein AZOA_00040 [Azoarcus sp. Aa7]|nr:hypothetical protein [Azoarcus sp. Aa7]